MLVVKSILSGELVRSPQKRSRSIPLHKSKQQQQLQQLRSPLVATSDERSFSETSNVTTLDDDTNNGEFSVGSTNVGDSFVLAIDWETTNIMPTNTGTAPSGPANNGLNDSLEDPYLPPIETVRRRLLKENSSSTVNRSTHNETTPQQHKAKSAAAGGIPEHVHGDKSAIRAVRRMMGGSSSPGARKQGKRVGKHPNGIPEQLSFPAASPCCKSLGSFSMPGKSLGSFDMPSMGEQQQTQNSRMLMDSPAGNNASTCNTTRQLLDLSDYNEEVDENRPSKAVTIPARARFDPASVSSQNDDDNDVEQMHDDSLVIPPTPTAHLSESRKRRYEARARVKEIKAALQQQSHSGKPKQMKTAMLYLELGLKELDARQHDGAVNSFFQAAAIYRHLDRPAALATALDHAGVAYCQAHQSGTAGLIHSQHKVSRFYRCFTEALQLRKEELGPWHVDTVDTLQHLAQLCTLTGHPTRAAHKYLEVVHLRKAIFGPFHPGTAVAAHCLGNAYMEMSDTVNAEIWYDYALTVYNHMELSSDNPSVYRLIRDRKRLERVDRWLTEENLADDENLLFDL